MDSGDKEAPFSAHKEVDNEQDSESGNITPEQEEEEEPVIDVKVM